jgi:hypothetical protein
MIHPSEGRYKRSQMSRAALRVSLVVDKCLTSTKDLKWHGPATVQTLPTKKCQQISPIGNTNSMNFLTKGL